MSYAVEFLRIAQKQLAQVDRQSQASIIEAIRHLATEPRPPACRKLSGRPAWRIRVGDYRVIYEINDNRLIVTVISIGHRREVYR